MRKKQAIFKTCGYGFFGTYVVNENFDFIYLNKDASICLATDRNWRYFLDLPICSVKVDI